MEFLKNGGYWKLGVLLAAAILNYGSAFISKKITDDEAKQMKIKMILKIIAFILAVAAAVSVMFL